MPMGIVVPAATATIPGIVALENGVASTSATKAATANAAKTANDTGAAAQTTANTAVTNAAAAQTTANTAVTNAATAQTTADGKVAKDHGHNNVGSLVFGWHNGASTTAGATYAGSSIFSGGIYNNSGTATMDRDATGLSGTWRALGSSTTGGASVSNLTLFQRIA